MQHIVRPISPASNPEFAFQTDNLNGPGSPIMANQSGTTIISLSKRVRRLEAELSRVNASYQHLLRQYDRTCSELNQLRSEHAKTLEKHRRLRRRSASISLSMTPGSSDVILEEPGIQRKTADSEALILRPMTPMDDDDIIVDLKRGIKSGITVPFPEMARNRSQTFNGMTTGEVVESGRRPATSSAAVILTE